MSGFPLAPFHPQDSPDVRHSVLLRPRGNGGSGRFCGFLDVKGKYPLRSAHNDSVCV